MVKEISSTKGLENVGKLLNTLVYSTNNTLANCDGLKPLKTLGGVTNG